MEKKPVAKKAPVAKKSESTVKVPAKAVATKTAATKKKTESKAPVMAMHTITYNEGARQTEKRLGRGIGSGLGKTSGKGHKGQNARSGGGVRPGFEGGQIPLIRRLPKGGFTNNFRKVYATVNVSVLNAMKEKVITEELLLEKRIIGKKQPYGLKVLGDGAITRAFTVKCNKITKQAEEKIVKAGGKVEIIK